MNKQTGETPGEYNTLDPLTFESDYHTDLWIARRVMEWPDVKESDPLHDYFHFGGAILGGTLPTIFRYGTIPDSFQPSSRMEDALQVLRMMKTKGWWYHVSGDPKNKDTMVLFGRDKGEMVDDIHSAYAHIEPLAICRAAGLAILGVKRD